MIRIGASVGVALSSHDTTVAGILADADMAMYDTKLARRGALRRSTIERRRTATERLRLVDEFIAGLGQGEIVAHLQPIVETRTRRLVSLEALARWNHPRSAGWAPQRSSILSRTPGSASISAMPFSSRPASRWINSRAHGHHPEPEYQPVPGAVDRRRHHRTNRADHPPPRPGTSPPRDRNHRERHPRAIADSCRSLLRPDPACTARLGGDAHAGRLRHWLLVTHPRSPLPPQRRQDRPQLRATGCSPATKTAPSSKRSLAWHAHSISTRSLKEWSHSGKLQALDALGCDRIQGHVIAEPMPGDAVLDWILHG